jgi:RimJ/RimL family protein N-acetyltransferase
MQEFTLKNNTQIILRKPIAEDFEAFTELCNKIASETTFTMQYVGQPKHNKENITKRWSDINNSFIFAFTKENNKLIALTGLVKDSPNHPFTKHIGDFGMFILKDYWGFGLGNLLLQNILLKAKEQNISRVEGFVRANNYRGINLYLKNGFTLEGCLKNRAFIDGKFVDEYIIAKILD